MQKLLSVEDNLFIKRLGRVVALIRNTIVYRGVGLDYLFKSIDESPLPQAKRSDFIARCEDLGAPSVTSAEITDLADFLQIDAGVGEPIVPYKSFEHYANRVHASE